MHKERNIQNIYFSCSEEGSFIPQLETEIELIKSIFNLAKIDLETAEKWSKNASKDSGEWNAIFKLYYDVLHGFCEAIVYFDRMKSKTHECLFAYVCEKHPELELNWNFLEEVRTKRNGIHYYGKPINYHDWTKLELQMKLHLHVLEEAIENKLTHGKK